MKVRWTLIFFLVLFAIVHTSEAGKLNRIQKLIEKHKLEKAEEVIQKMIGDDQVSPGAKFFYSILYSDTSFYKFNIDSAHYYIKEAVSDYDASPVDDLKELRRVDITPIDFERQESFVTKLAFGRATGAMTLEAFNEFLNTYPEAAQTARAITFRDSLAYEIVLASNTWQAYKTYYDTYPQSAYATEAMDRYQILIFKDYTKEDNLDGYIQFLDDHPDTPFRKEAEEIILVRSTIDNQWSSYVFFLEKYPKTHLRKKIGDIMYYQALQSGSKDWQDVLEFHNEGDSLRKMHEINEKVLFPVAESGSFGFMSLAGEPIVPIKYPFIPEHYLCGNISASWIEVGIDGARKAILRSGTEMLTNIQGISEIGQSVILAKGENGGLYHQSGFRITGLNIDEASELNNGWIAFSVKDQWGLITPVGYEIIPPELEYIGTDGAFFILQKGGMYAITNAEELMQEHYQLNYAFDDFEVINDTLVQGYQGDKECLINKKLEYLRPLQAETIYVNNSFWYQKGANGYEIFDIEDQEIIGETFDYLEVNEGWITLKKDAKWLLISRRLRGVLPVRDLDSVKLINSGAAFIKGDTLQLIFQNSRREWIQPDVSIQVLSGGEKECILLSSPKFQEVFDHEGAPLFNTRYDQLSILTDTLFRFKVKNKYGVVDLSGNVLIEAKYDLIDPKGDMLILLSDSKIGGYDLTINKLISAVYKSRIDKIGDHYKVQIDGKVGLIDFDANEKVPAIYEDIRFWNDTSLWAKNQDGWEIISYTGELLKDGILSFEPWLSRPDEAYVIVLEKEGYGLLSNKRGQIVASEYNEILNLGTTEQPVIFAEQHLNTAAFYVVTYLDINGVVMRSQAFRPEEYTEIYCDH